MSKQFQRPKFEVNLGYYIGIRNKVGYYLHTDGVIRDSCVHNGKLTGWFKTKEEAYQAIRNYGLVTIRQLEV